MLNIKELRIKAGLSQQKLSDLTGIPAGRINNWEQGKGKPKAEYTNTLIEFFTIKKGADLSPLFPKQNYL